MNRTSKLLEPFVASTAPDRPRSEWPATARIAAAIIATTSLVLLMAACGRGSSNPSGAAAHETVLRQALAYSRCMRSNGVQNYPDPSSNGVLSKETPQQYGVTQSQYQAATQACQHLNPNRVTGTTLPTRSWSDWLNFAHCMRNHGVQNWPDPTPDPAHPERPNFNLQPLGINPNSPQISPKIHECEPLLQGTNPQHLGDGAS